MAPLRVGPGAVWRWGVPLVALGLFTLVLATDSNAALFGVINAWSSVTGQAVWAHLTALGGGAVVAALVLPFAGRRPDVVWAALLLAAACFLSVELCKGLVLASRPAAVLPPGRLLLIGRELHRNSFPSGHATTAFALAGLLVLSVVRRGPRLLLVALAALVGLSRIVVGAHWPLDVLAGAALGWALAVLALTLARRWTWGLRQPVQLVLALVLVASSVRLLADPGRDAATVAFQRAVAALVLVLAAPGCWRLLARRQEPRPLPAEGRTELDAPAGSR